MVVAMISLKVFIVRITFKPFASVAQILMHHFDVRNDYVIEGLHPATFPSWRLSAIL